MHHRTRYNQPRPERTTEMEAISQASHMPQHPVTPLTPFRKANYARAELAPMQRGTTPMVTTRTKRLPTLHGNIKGHLSPRPVGVGVGVGNGSEVAANRRNTTTTTRTHFLPRVAKLANNNSSVNNNTVKVRDKSPAASAWKQPKPSAYLNSVCDSSSLNGRTVPVQLQKMSQPQQQQMQQQLPLLGNSNSCSVTSSSNDLRKIKLAKAFRLPDEQNKSFVYLCKPVKKVKELLKVQSLNNSLDNLHDEPQRSTIHHFVDESDSCSSCCSQEFELGVLETQQQLLDVRQQLAAKVQDLEQSSDRQQQAEEQKVRKRHRNRDRDKEAMGERAVDEMEFVCQNIPTLQREIKLLQQLGEKLEATLRANIPCPPTTTPRSSPHDDAHSLYYTPRSQANLAAEAQLAIVQLGWRLEEIMCHLTQRAYIVASLRSFGCIREFRIETRTLTELKTADETQCFYLPLAEDGGLQCTSFRQLRENPNVLLRQLKPVTTSSRPFNLLEQDAMFFNSMLGHGEVNSPSASLDQLLPPRESGGGNYSNFPLSAHLVGRPQTCPIWTTADVERLLISTVNATVQCEFPPAESATFSMPTSCRRGVFKCRWPRPKLKPSPKITVNPTRRQVAPLKPRTEDLEPEVQTQLLKTVLVGIVQVAVFLILIMAFTYPDIRC